MGRLIMAGLFVVVGMGAAVVLLSQLGFDGEPVWLTSVLMPVLFLFLVGAAMALFNGGGPESSANPIQHWEERGLLNDTEFRARRAFQVEEFEDEGSHYFLELEDGTVLYLNGQYLHDYEPVEDDDPEFCEPRRFPCTEFTVRRHRIDGFVVDIDCRGKVLEPEEVQPPFTTAEYQRFNLGDGEIIRDRTYDEIRAGRDRISRGF